MNILPRCLLLAAALFSLGACQTSDRGESETSPVGPPVLSAALEQEALRSPVEFSRHVQPILQQNCGWCHDGKSYPLLVNFSEKKSVLGRGPYGLRVIPGRPDDSLLVNNLSQTHAPIQTMPPVGSRLTPVELKILKKWIQEGAR